MPPLTIVVLIIVIIAISLSLLPNKKLQAYWSRNCAGRAWKHEFPDATKTEIRQFLHLFADAFLFDKGKALVFRPDDKVMDIYRASYSRDLAFLAGDACECECFASDFRNIYKKDPLPIWSLDLTLGQLFALAHTPNQSFNPDAASTDSSLPPTS